MYSFSCHNARDCPVTFHRSRNSLQLTLSHWKMYYTKNRKHCNPAASVKREVVHMLSQRPFPLKKGHWPKMLILNHSSWMLPDQLGDSSFKIYIEKERYVWDTERENYNDHTHDSGVSKDEQTAKQGRATEMSEGQATISRYIRKLWAARC